MSPPNARRSTAASTPTASDDVLTGTPGNDNINALAGNDTVIALAGDDRVFGGPGNDDIVAGDGNDFVDGGIGNDLIFGGSGADAPFENGAGNDTLIGGAGADTIFGQSGDDSIDGGDGNDNIDGGFGNDSIRGGAGSDRVFASFSDDRIFGEAGNDQLNGDIGNDTIDGGAGDDVAFGAQGDDSLSGDNGSDRLLGGSGNDNLSGGAGNDRLIGADASTPANGFGAGERDNLTGGGGSDTFVLGTNTQVFYDNQGNNDFALINDFNLNQDFIELTANPPSRVAESGDAGQTLANAQVIPAGSGQLGSINGSISEVNDVDLYQINVTDGAAFTATTVGGANFDTQLFLFDASGNVIAQNDDSNGLQSTLSNTSIAPGTYFLGISSFNNDPTGSPVPDFTNDGFSTGDYTIAVEGVSSAPSTYSLGASPDGLPQGTAISLDNDLIGIVAGVSPSQLSLSGGQFVFV